MKSCLECEEKIIGREDKSFVATVVVMPTTIKSIKTVNLCATLIISCAKNSHSIGSMMGIKTTRAKLL
jgi:flagellar assembly factor FliW